MGIAKSIQQLCLYIGQEDRNIVAGFEEEDEILSHNRHNKSVNSTPVGDEFRTQRASHRYYLSPSKLTDSVPQIGASELILNALSIEFDICDVIVENKAAMLSHRLLCLRTLLLRMNSMREKLLASKADADTLYNGSVTELKKALFSANKSTSDSAEQQVPTLYCEELAQQLDKLAKRLEKLSENETILQKAMKLYVALVSWQKGLVKGTFFHTIVSETKAHFEDAISIR